MTQLIAGIIALLGGLGAALYALMKQRDKKNIAEAEAQTTKDRAAAREKVANETHRRLNEVKHDSDIADRVRDRYKRED